MAKGLDNHEEHIAKFTLRHFGPEKRQINRTMTLDWNKQMVTLFGETKTVVEWEADPRMSLKPGSLRKIVMQEVTGIDEDAEPEAPKETLTAWGETKELDDWAEDPRCAVGIGRIRLRMRKWKVSPELILATPPIINQEGLKKVYKGFGTSKTLGEWILDKRRKVSASLLPSRLKSNWSIEDAMTTPPNISRDQAILESKVTAFGETRRVQDWPFEKVCVVGVKRLVERLNDGWPPEFALTVPTYGSPPRGMKKIKPGKGSK